MRTEFKVLRSKKSGSYFFGRNGKYIDVIDNSDIKVGDFPTFFPLYTKLDRLKQHLSNHTIEDVEFVTAFIDIGDDG